jgi:hypothetical protein
VQVPAVAENAQFRETFWTLPGSIWALAGTLPPHASEVQRLLPVLTKEGLQVTETVSVAVAALSEPLAQVTEMALLPVPFGTEFLHEFVQGFFGMRPLYRSDPDIKPVPSGNLGMPYGNPDPRSRYGIPCGCGLVIAPYGAVSHGEPSVGTRTPEKPRGSPLEWGVRKIRYDVKAKFRGIQ